jgi:hypothetical protein
MYDKQLPKRRLYPMHAFIVRPFGIKSGIDFDRVDRELIGPALDHFNISGGTTGDFIQQGNIRTDMFEQLLIADLVVADISIHNANAFYELGPGRNPGSHGPKCQDALGCRLERAGGNRRCPEGCLELATPRKVFRPVSKGVG